MFNKVLREIIVNDKRYKVFFRFAYLDKIYYACKLKEKESAYSYVRLNNFNDEYILETSPIIIERLNNIAKDK